MQLLNRIVATIAANIQQNSQNRDNLLGSKFSKLICQQKNKHISIRMYVCQSKCFDTLKLFFEKQNVKLKLFL